MNHQIDENLRRVYNEALNDRVPDKFMELIRQLKEAEEDSAKDPQMAEKDNDGQ